MAAAAQTLPAPAPHVPVLLAEVVAALAPLDGALVIDGTYGAGGYSRAFLAAGAAVLGIDRDPAALDAAEPAPGLILVEGAFADLDAIAGAHAPRVADRVVLDIGVSSMQLDQGARGFSFLRDGPLDMRMSGHGPSAADLVNHAPEADLADVIYRFGEDRASRRIAKAIVAARATGPITGTRQLAAIVEGCLPRPRPGQAHPATRTFQALRIAVNDELGQLARALAAAERLLPEGGRLAVVTFHSLEDRMVKRFFQIGSATSGGGSRHGPDRTVPPARWMKPAKPVEAGPDELAVNPRARSARLRWAERTGADAVDLDPRSLGMPATPALDAMIKGGRR